MTWPPTRARVGLGSAARAGVATATTASAARRARLRVSRMARRLAHLTGPVIQRTTGGAGRAYVFAGTAVYIEQRLSTCEVCSRTLALQYHWPGGRVPSAQDPIVVRRLACPACGHV